MPMWVPQFLLSLLAMSPWLLVDLVAAIFALIWRRRYPRVSFLLLLGISLGVVIAIISNFLIAWLPDFSFTDSYDHSKFERNIILMQWIGMIRSILGAGAYSILIVAIFIDRAGKKPAPNLQIPQPLSRACQSLLEERKIYP